MDMAERGYLFGCDPTYQRVYGFADTGGLFSYPLKNARWVSKSTRARARGCILAPESAPVGFDTRGYAGILCPLPS